MRRGGVAIRAADGVIRTADVPVGGAGDPAHAPGTVPDGPTGGAGVLGSPEDRGEGVFTALLELLLLMPIFSL